MIAKNSPISSTPADKAPAAEQPASDDNEKPAKVDPVKVNGPIFEGWTKPNLAIVITGEQLGYLEPCGCAGLENQKGGLGRRATLIKQLRDEGWPVLPIDLGGLVRRFGQQEELKFQTAIEALRAMDYGAIGWGAEDLKLGAGNLLAATTENDGRPSRFVSANVGLFELDLSSPERYRILEAGGHKIGVTAILGTKFQKDVHNDDIKLADPEQALAQIVPQLKEKTDYRILLSYAEPDETIQLAKRFPEFQAVVTAQGADEPPREPRKIAGTDTWLIEVGHKGMFAVVLGFYDGAKEPIRYQRVPIDSRFVDAPEMRALLTTYEGQLRDLGWAGLGLQAAVNPRAKAPGDADVRFIGSEACGECHKTAYNIWLKTPHSHATETLAKLDPPRQFDPECISCHATGWKPQEFVPFESGFTSLAETPHLKGNGCENCHGPGAAHAAAERGKDEALREKFRTAMQETSSCEKCHDLDNSPKFDHAKYWPKVEHEGKN
jgi:hypothetical protein